MRRARDRRNRVAPEAGLERSHHRLTDPRQRGLRPRDRANAIHDVLRPRIDEHFEELFARLGVVRQGSVGKTKAGGIGLTANLIQDAATIERPEAEVPDQDRDDGARRDGRVTRERFHPADVELLPGDQRRSGPLEVGDATADCNGRLIEPSADDRMACHDSDRTV